MSAGLERTAQRRKEGNGTTGDSSNGMRSDLAGERPARNLAQVGERVRFGRATVLVLLGVRCRAVGDSGADVRLYGIVGKRIPQQLDAL